MSTFSDIPPTVMSTFMGKLTAVKKEKKFCF